MSETGRRKRTEVRRQRDTDRLLDAIRISHGESYDEEELRKATSLRLSNTYPLVRNVHPAAFSLVALTTLDLRRNVIVAIPAKISHLVNLETLLVSHNRLTCLPDAIGKLERLEHLDVSDNALEILPKTIGKLRNLVRIDASDNDLDVVPKEFSDLRKLARADFGQNGLGKLPVQIGNVSSLESLDCDHNFISVLPPSLGKLDRLRSLRIGHNPFERFPTSFSKLSCEFLRGVDGVLGFDGWPDPRPSLLDRHWRRVRLLILGHSQDSCILSVVPFDIIREVASFLFWS